MAQAAKQLKKIKDIEAQALQEQKEKEESNRKRRNRSRDRKKKVSGAGVAALQWACAVAASVAVPGALQGGHRAAWSLCVCQPMEQSVKHRTTFGSRNLLFTLTA